MIAKTAEEGSTIRLSLAGGLLGVCIANSSTTMAPAQDALPPGHKSKVSRVSRANGTVSSRSGVDR